MAVYTHLPVGRDHWARRNRRLRANRGCIPSHGRGKPLPYGGASFTELGFGRARRKRYGFGIANAQ